jgi:S1-C subfamily serine protease
MTTRLWKHAASLLFYPLAAFSQTLGTATAPEDLLKATLLIETAQSVTNTKFLPFGIFRQEGERTIQVTPTNLVVQVAQPETIFRAAGSGVLLTQSNVNLFVTAKHVVQANEDVFFRVPQKSGGADHRAHRAMKQITGIGWIYSTNADIALSVLSIKQVDDVSFIPVGGMTAAYESVSVGDDIFVSGFPSSVVELETPALRNGIVSAKLGDAMILIDTTTFPGNSGGPVFWKPSMGINIFGNQVGRGRPASLIGLALYSPLYSEGAVSPASGRTRIVFEANSGLTKVVSTTRILELLNYPEAKAAVARALGR